jgi:hypothetical protein
LLKHVDLSIQFICSPFSFSRFASEFKLISPAPIIHQEDMADHNAVKKSMLELICGCFSSSRTKD